LEDSFEEKYKRLEKRLEENNKRDKLLFVSKGYELHNIKKPQDLNDLSDRLLNPYRNWMIVCFLGVIISYVLLILTIKKGGASIFFSVLAIFLGSLIFWLKSKRNEIKKKIYMWGVEETWNFYKNKSE